MQRIYRYKEVIGQMLAAGTAYYCYTSKEELDALRAAQEAKKEKPRYDGRWRPEPGKVLSTPPAGIPPVVRFRSPADGVTVLDDLIKGPITFENRELDDLIIARADGVPTYNFCVVVDDLDMGITHVIRGDDHVNNTPRQMNILRALGAEPPQYAHVSMILGADGAKLSKRHGALGVMEYRTMGFMPEALLNYLVRLGWSHGDQELFTREEMTQLFDLSKVSSSAARFDMEKAYWVNHQYLKIADPAIVAVEFEWHLRRLGMDPVNGPALTDVILAQRERCRTLAEMAEKSLFLYAPIQAYNDKDAAKHFNDEGARVLAELHQTLTALGDWSAAAIHEAVNRFAESRGLGLGKVAQPIRVAVVGAAVSPPIDQTLALLGRQRTLERLAAAVAWMRSRAPA
jgi:glutamyl-tRNA synthetase